jgi:hypothetical protein
MRLTNELAQAKASEMIEEIRSLPFREACTATQQMLDIRYETLKRYAKLKGKYGEPRATKEFNKYLEGEADWYDRDAESTLRSVAILFIEPDELFQICRGKADLCGASFEVVADEDSSIG